VFASPLILDGTRFRVQVDRKGVLTVWRVTDGGENVLGTGLLEQAGAAYKVRDFAPPMALDLLAAIERLLKNTLARRKTAGQNR